MKRHTLLLFLFVCSVSLIQSAAAYSWLYIRDPRGWGGGQGTIEEAVFSIRPKGLYMECGMYLTFSANGLYFSSNDSLEVEFYFDLPEGSIVHDSWLWIDGQIIRGTIMDKWTAASIYENIVKRRRDPSILYKQYDNSYELRIFPMVGNEKRKVKITFLVPTQWSATNVTAALPLDLLQTSRKAISNVHIYSWLDDEWRHPQILEYPDSFFKSNSDEKFGNYESLRLPATVARNRIHFMVDSPLADDVYLSVKKNDDEGLYQLAFLPSAVLEQQAARKIAVLIDYRTANSSISKQAMLSSLEAAMKMEFSDKDAFNLFYTDQNIKKMFDTWAAADRTTIETTFSRLKNESFGIYSNLSALISEALQFIQANDDHACILLLSNTDHFNDHESANALVRSIQSMMPRTVPIHILDYQDRNYHSVYIGNSYYNGNEYFFTNMAKLSGGDYRNVRQGGAFAALLTETLRRMGGFIKSFDFHPTLDNGYTFGRFNLDQSDQFIYLNEPILQISKFNGAGNFKITLAGEYDQDIFTKTIDIDPQIIFAADSLIEEMWSGNYIARLEGQDQSNDIINEIVDLSVAERVLSIYSAFLCLEPAQGGVVCYDCLDESELVQDVLDLSDAESDSIFQAAPNPFNAATKIHIRLTKIHPLAEISFEIFNVLGQRIKTFEAAQFGEEKEFNIIWDSTDDYGSPVASGTYFFVMSYPGGRQSLKLLLMK
ncbi:hypothetical protein EH222_12870 [candidate division KSB1 bacterium]|nr:MAG: hypothetical protein EH222_12870 [candidate division KSB1 bacterium]